jgi:hypothetical protein
MMKNSRGPDQRYTRQERAHVSRTGRGGRPRGRYWSMEKWFRGHMRHCTSEDETGLSIRRPGSQTDPGSRSGSQPRISHCHPASSVAVGVRTCEYHLDSALPDNCRMPKVPPSFRASGSSHCNVSHRAPFYRPDQLVLARLGPRTMPRESCLGWIKGAGLSH